MENEKTFDLAVANTETRNDDNTMLIADLTSRTTQYCSMTATTEEEKAQLFNATNNPEFRLGDMINTVISVKDVFVEAVECTNRETGECTACPRIVLIDVDGKGYACVSLGIFSAIKKLFGIYGEPRTWKTPLKVVVKQVTKGDRKMLTLNVATA